MSLNRLESPLVSSLWIVALTVLGLGIARIVGKVRIVSNVTRDWSRTLQELGV